MQITTIKLGLLATLISAVLSLPNPPLPAQQPQVEALKIDFDRADPPKEQELIDLQDKFRADFENKYGEEGIFYAWSDQKTALVPANQPVAPSITLEVAIPNISDAGNWIDARKAMYGIRFISSVNIMSMLPAGYAQLEFKAEVTLTQVRKLKETFDQDEEYGGAYWGGITEAPRTKKKIVPIRGIDEANRVKLTNELMSRDAGLDSVRLF